MEAMAHRPNVHDEPDGERDRIQHLVAPYLGE
jgi:hypothetical protein